jgi:hypothetical protein
MYPNAIRDIDSSFSHEEESQDKIKNLTQQPSTNEEGEIAP